MKINLIFFLFINFLGINLMALDARTYGTFRAEKLGNSETILIDTAGVREIRIQNLEHRTRVNLAKIYTNRGSYNLRALERTLRDRQEAVVQIDPRDFIYSLELNVSSQLRGSRGRFQVTIVFDDRGYRPPRRPDRRPPPPPNPRPHPPHGAYDPSEARIVYDLIKDFGWSMNGLNLSMRESEALARDWTRRGRVCGNSWEIRDMIYAFDRAYNNYKLHYRRSPDKQLREWALNDIRYFSNCSDLFYVR